uniref:Uncharacterized protein n=1 Tax=Syphacia muris TaxID=451379 RepID=A0A0N5AJC1_9BILA
MDEEQKLCDEMAEDPDGMLNVMGRTSKAIIQFEVKMEENNLQKNNPDRLVSQICNNQIQFTQTKNQTRRKDVVNLAKAVNAAATSKGIAQMQHCPP